MCRKSGLVLLGLLLLLGLVLGSSCGGAPPPTPAPKPAPAPSPETSPAPKPAPAPATIKWKAQSGTPLNSWAALMQFIPFANMVKEKSEGRLEIEIFAPGAIVDAYEIFGATQKNALQVGMGVGGYVTKSVPEGYVEEGLPGTFSSPDDYLYFLLYYKGGLVHKIIDEGYRAQGAHLLKSEGVYEQSIMSKRPISSVAEIKGLKIRASGANVDLMKNLGASPVTMPPTEVYMALQTGTIDGTGMPAYSIKTLKFWDVAKGMLFPSFGLASTNIWVSLEAYNSLPDDLKLIVEWAATEASHIYNYESKTSLVQLLKEAEKEHGVKWVTLSSEEFGKIRAAAAPILDDAAKRSPRSAQIVELIKEFLATK